MIKSVVSLCLLAAIIHTAGCSTRQWTAEQRKDFQTKCSQQETISSLQVNFRGFDDKSFESIEVKEFENAKLVSTFRVPVPPSQDQRDRDYKIRRAKIDRTMILRHSYEFIIPGQRPYKLADMKMIMWAQYTMKSEGWGCVMGDYTIDGKRFEHDVTPEFVKKQ